ncbi:translocation and assembly module lipoprotein TamL [Psychroflexus planctonicus]|uniref:Membrane protein n=1 Tax=Psychroflexus planctonicus TaxID=1526575 RepID=A0ABQ1SEP4_9FLAO|nr:BamA/TamA family outer membrane protein [Psychroflexus planctonicus]GGE27738.1 membrane protein [Psychroflexus planctonicus]
MSALLFSCNALKHLEEDEQLLVENTVIENDANTRKRNLKNLLKQEPNSTLLGVPLKLHILNLAKKDPDSTFNKWLYKKPNRVNRLVGIFSKKQVVNIRSSYVGIQNQIKKIGEKPTIYDEQLTKLSKNRLKSWFWNHGWFNAEVDYEKIDTENPQKTKLKYSIQTGEPYVIGQIEKNISSPAIDSIYQAHVKESHLKKNKQYNTEDFNSERERLTRLMRNNGVYYFEREKIEFEADTLNTNQKVNVGLKIANRIIRNKDQDSVQTETYKVHKISEVNIFTNYNAFDKNAIVTDSLHYKDLKVFSFGKLRYKPKVLADAIFIEGGKPFREIDRNRTFNRFSDLRVFKYPNIQYQPDPRDPDGEDLIANIFLTPREKFGYSISSDVSQSNIMDIGIGFNTSLLVRNVFRGAEVLEISGRGIIGSSKDAASASDRFFNINEIGSNIRLSWPKIAFPLKTESIINKSMSPFTSLGVGFSSQQNIGLDRRNFTGSFSYRWKPRRQVSNQLDLINVQFVNNLNVQNYFNVFGNSFVQLNELAIRNRNQVNSAFFETTASGNEQLIIPEGTDGFINQIENDSNLNLNEEEFQQASSIIERKNRLTENNLIIASNFSFDYSNRSDIKDHDFYQIRTRLELAGNLVNALSKPLNLEQNANDTYNLFGVQFSQYVKTEVNYIKHWDLGKKRIIATRAYTGAAIPYGNANSIPFIRSFFAGGPNDNRGWQPYDLGPGRTGGVNDFNEANFKLAFNAEYRFNLFGSLNSAIFVDAGNIWNLWDNVSDEDATFNGLESLKDLSIGSGFGLRYDLSFFVIRVDFGFKTYEPGLNNGEWMQNFNFANVVYNFGINYPF